MQASNLAVERPCDAPLPIRLLRDAVEIEADIGGAGIIDVIWERFLNPLVQ